MVSKVSKVSNKKYIYILHCFNSVTAVRFFSKKNFLYMYKTLANLANLANWRPNAKVIANQLLTGLQTGC